MTGLQYSGDLGGQYGGDHGGHYGYLRQGDSLFLTKPGSEAPSRVLEGLCAVDIEFEHTALSQMTVDIPPFEGVDADTYTDGSMAYVSNGRRLFAAEIDDVSIAEDNTVTLSGTSLVGKPLEQSDHSVIFEEILTKDAIENFARGNLPYTVRIHDPPYRPLDNRLVESMNDRGDFAEHLEVGERVGDDPELVRDFPDSASQFFPPDFVPTLHETTPITLLEGGLTATQTTIFIEAEDADRNAPISQAGGQSGGRGVRIGTQDHSLRLEFAFAHDIPKGWFDVAFRARTTYAGPEPYDRLEFSIDGETLATRRTSTFVNYGTDFRWYLGQFSYSERLEAANVSEGDSPHEFTITKVEGDDDIVFDCFAVRDARFSFQADINEQVDSNNALSGPALYPSFVPIYFDTPPVGADISAVDWTVNYDHKATFGYPVITIPKTGRTDYTGDFSEPGVKRTEQVDIPDDETVTRVYGGAFIGNYSDPNRTVSPTENTETQVVQSASMHIDGREISVLSEEQEFTGTPLSILQDLHEHADRRFTLEHGVTDPSNAQFESFVTGDDSLVQGDSDEWVITSATRDVADEGDANLVSVEGAQTPTGAYYRGIARDEEAIQRLDADTPESDDGVRPVFLVDRSLTSDNDCLSRARTELHARSRMEIGGDVSTGPMLVEPGYPYRLRMFEDGESNGNVGYGYNYGLNYGIGDTGVLSSLETTSYSVAPGSASTSLSFERTSGLFRAFEEIASGELDKRPRPARDDVPVVSAAEIYQPPSDDEPSGEEPPQDTNEPPTASFTISDPTVTTGTEITFDGSPSSDPDGTINFYQWDFGDGSAAGGETVSHAYSEGGTYTITFTVGDNDGAFDQATDTVTISDPSQQEPVAYLPDNNPLAYADYRVGGSAGDGTHGGHHVERPAGMPTKAECDYVIRTGHGLKDALQNGGPGVKIYIDDDADISNFDRVELPPNCKLVGGFCDPNIPGGGPVLFNNDDPPYKRRHLITRDYVELWGVRFHGPEGEYFDPRDRPGDESDYYISAIMTFGLDENGREGYDSWVYGCEFSGWTVAGLEIGERTTPSVCNIERCTFHHNNMETLGYGIEQWNGHGDVSWCYTNDNRHDFSGFGYYTESWDIHDCMHGTTVLSHAYDMHGLNQNLGPSYPNHAGDHVHVRRCTFPFLYDDRPQYSGKQEGVTVRGVPEHEVQIYDNHFYHSQPPAGDGPGVNGDPFRQDNIDQDHFVRFNYGGNNYGERLEDGKGCPLNRPVK